MRKHGGNKGTQANFWWEQGNMDPPWETLTIRLKARLLDSYVVVKKHSIAVKAYFLICLCLEQVCIYYNL